MSEKTNIEWANHTGGPWLICSMVSAGCTNCYAMALMLTRLGPMVRKAYKAAGFGDWETRPIWGDKATRVLSKGFWTDARRINAQHAKAGTRGRWFPSMIDWLDLMPSGIIDQDGNKLDPIEVLADFLHLIHDTPNLDWLLLTKRPENFLRDGSKYSRIEKASELLTHPARTWVHQWFAGFTIPHNVWIGVSIEDQKRADERLPLLAEIPARIRFASFEPLLERIDPKIPVLKQATQLVEPVFGLDWAIIGGESGKGRRDCGVQAICDLAETLSFTNGIQTFIKQDCAFKPGQQGRIPADVWALKEFPKV